MHKELLEGYYFKIDKKAEECWKNGEYAITQALFKKHINSLSKAQIKKLEIAFTRGIRENISPAYPPIFCLLL